MKKKIILALCSLLIAGGGIGMVSIPHEEQPVSPELLAEAMVEEEPEEIIEETAEVKVCEEGCTLEPGHEGDCVVKKEDIEVVLKSTSMERDLKVKFVNKATGKVISGADFKMKVTSPSKKTKEYSDHDKDGIIWVKDIDGGNYTVEMLELEGYVTAKNLTAEVKKKIEYKVVEVADEVKNESQVNVSQEDGAYGGTDKDDSTSGSSVLKDTVEFVASSSKQVTTNGAQKTDSFNNPVYEKQAVDGFGQKVYKELKKDDFGTPMYATILSEPASYHVDKDENGVCDRCSAAMPQNNTSGGGNEDPSGSDSEDPAGGESEGTTGGGSEGTTGGESEDTPESGTETTTENGQARIESENSYSFATKRISAFGIIIRPFNFLRASSEAATVAETEKIVYDTKSAPVYDTSSAPVYDTSSAPVYETSTTTVYYGWQTIDGATYYFDKNGNKVTGSQVIEGVAYTFSSEGVRSGTIGIDVSKYQTGINWTKVKNAGINFVMIRCGYRGYGSGVLVEDPMFRSHISGAKAAGLRVGVYFFSQAVNEAEAVEEASMAVSLAKKYGINMPIAIDSELAAGGRGRADGLSKSARTAITKAFCNTVKSAGYTPMVYASKSWFGSRLDTSQLSGYRIWVAHYSDKCGYSGRYDIWQNTDKGKVDGIPSRVDMNISSI